MMSEAPVDRLGWRVKSGYEVYAVFRHKVDYLKFGPRGGMIALVNGKWVRVRKTRSTKKETV